MNKNDMHLLDGRELTKVSGGVIEQAGRDDVFSKVQGIFAAKLGIPAGFVGANSSIVEELGADSLDVVDIIGGLEDQFQIKINQTEPGGVRTVGDLCDLVHKSM